MFTSVEMPEEVAEAAISARERIQAPIVVPNEPPTSFHPFAQALRRALKSAKPDDQGFLRRTRGPERRYWLSKSRPSRNFGRYAL